MTKPEVTPRVMALAAALRAVRTDAKFGLRELARRIGVSPQMLSQWERALRTPRVEDVAAILGGLGVIDERKAQIMDLARGATDPSWITHAAFAGLPQQLRTVIECENSAESLVECAPLTIPGLLQTPRYALNQMTAGGLSPYEADQRVMVRMERRRRIVGDNPTRFEALIGEAPLRDRIGTPDVMAEQLRFLIEMSDARNITLRVIPSGIGRHPGLAGAFILYELSDSNPVVYFEHLYCGAFVPDESVVTRYRAAIKGIHAVAMSPRDSVAFIARLAEEIESEASWTSTDLAESA